MLYSSLRTIVVAALVLLLTYAIPCRAIADTPLSYVDILHQLTDLDRLAHLQTGYRAGLFSSWDRKSYTVWGANGDSGQYLRTEPSGEAVMVDVDGPGVIYRTWSANPMGKIRIYLDGDMRPTYEWSFPDLFDGKMAPFIKPIVYRRDSAESASDCYLPIPFSRHIKITADKANGQYYQFNYMQFPKDKSVDSFRLPLSAGEQAALATAADAWRHPEKDPKPILPEQTTIKRTVRLGGGKTATLASLTGAGEIRSVKMKVISPQRYAWRKLVLRGVWDKAEWPQVLTPIGPFFGFDWDTPDYASVISGCRNGQAYQYLPMPFRKSGVLSLTSYLEQPVTVQVEIEWAPLKSVPNDMVYFYARWRHEPDSVTFDYPFLETAGHGHFVGVSMPIDHPLGGWWGEGDDKVWVDDDDFPPWIGTGSEDYFGDAWGIRYLSGPSYGAASMSDKAHRTCNYRWHFMDSIPFEKRMKMTIENYGPNGVGPRGQYDYSSTAFWYQQEVTPPFSELVGHRFTGGDDPNGKPKTMYYAADTMADITASSVRTYGLGIPFALQADTLMAEEVSSNRAKVVTDAKRNYEFDRERALDFGTVKTGDRLGELSFTAAGDAVYYPRLYTAQEVGIADLTLENGGRPAAIVGHPRNNVLELAGIYLTKGDHKIPIVAQSAGHAIFNCLQLEPAPRVRDAVEAEELTVLRETGGGPMPHPGEPILGASAGRVLEFPADKQDQGYVVSLGKRPAMPYVLGVQAMMGPDSGIVRAFVAGTPIGPQFDLYAPDQHPAAGILPLGPVPAGSTEVEIRVVGKNAQSRGYTVLLDYFRWEPDILGPGTADGVWAQVVATHDCDYRAQDLGVAYSGGHQFWIQPSNLNAWVDIAIQIPAAREYEFTVRYTRSWDYATSQAFLDGKPLGSATDTYAAAVGLADPLSLGKLPLSKGRHILRFQAVGHNPASKGYLIGIDHVIVQ